MVVREWRFGGKLVAVVAAGFEAVVAVSDEHGLARHECSGAIDRVHIHDWPEAMQNPEVVGGF